MDTDRLFSFNSVAFGRNESLFVWLIKLRWLIVLTTSFGLFGAGLLGKIAYEHFVPMILVTISVCIFNSSAQIKITNGASIKSIDLFWQVAFDLLALFAWLFLLSEFMSPMIEFFLINFILIVLVCEFKLSFLLFLFTLLLEYILAEKASQPFSHLLFTAVIIYPILSWAKMTLWKYHQTFLKVQATKQQMDRLKFIGAMTSGVCHELATPLNTAKLKISRITRKKEWNEHDLAICQESIERCIDLIHSLAKTAHSGDQENIKERINLSSLTGHLLQSWNQEKIKFNSSTPIWIEANTQLLSQTLLDLIENAVEASGEDNVDIEISTNHDSILWIIKNKMAQISPLVINKLGEPFVTDKKSGTGLGLFNAQNLMLALNGSFRIFNENPSTVAVELRFQK